METPNWRELIKDILVNPRTPIEDGKVLAVRGGGGIEFSRRGTRARLIGTAKTNADALEVIVLILGESGQGISISISDPYGIQTAHMQMAAIADYHGVDHDFRPKGKQGRDRYEPIRQMIYAHLDEKYGEDRSSIGLQTKPPPKRNNKIVIAIIILSIGFIGYQHLKPEDLNEYMSQQSQNRNIGKDSKDFSQIIRAFKTKHPEAFGHMITSINNEKNKGGAFFTVYWIARTPSWNPQKPNKNLQEPDYESHESIRLYLALKNIKSCLKGCYGWPNLDQTFKAFLNEANKS